MTLQEALNNFQFLANKFQGTLAEHMAIGKSIQVLREYIAPTPVESSAGVPEPEDISPKRKKKRTNGLPK